MIKIVDSTPVVIDHGGNIGPRLLFINIVSLKMIFLLILHVHLLLLLYLITEAELLGHKVSIDLGLLHDEFEALLLQHRLPFLLLLPTELLLILLSLALQISNLLVTLLPESHHVLVQLLSTKNALLLEPLSLQGFLADLFKAVLALFLVVVFEI